MALILNLMMITWMCILNLLFYFTLTTQSFFSKSEDQLVSVLNTFMNYCSLWKLNINYDKTKIQFLVTETEETEILLLIITKLKL